MDGDWMEEIWEALPEIGEDTMEHLHRSSDDEQHSLNTTYTKRNGRNDSELETALNDEREDDQAQQFGMDLEENQLEYDQQQSSSNELQRRQQELREAMEEIVEEWIDEPTTELVSARELRRWRNHLQFMDEVMKGHAKRRSPVYILQEVYRYAVKGHRLYKGTLEDRVNDEEVTGPDRQDAERMLLRYEGTRSLQKYFDKGIRRLENDKLEWMSDTTSLASTTIESTGGMTQQARQMVEDERRKHKEEMKRLKEQMEEDQRRFREEMEYCRRRDTEDYQEEMHFVLAEKKKELERGKASAKSLMQENNLVRKNLAVMEQRLADTKQQNSEFHRKIRETEDRMADGEMAMAEAQNRLRQEKQLRMRQERARMEMEQELLETRRRYNDLEERKLFPDAEIFNQEERRQRTDNDGGDKAREPRRMEEKVGSKEEKRQKNVGDGNRMAREEQGTEHNAPYQAGRNQSMRRDGEGTAREGRRMEQGGFKQEGRRPRINEGNCGRRVDSEDVSQEGLRRRTNEHEYEMVARGRSLKREDGSTTGRRQRMEEDRFHQEERRQRTLGGRMEMRDEGRRVGRGILHQEERRWTWDSENELARTEGRRIKQEITDSSRDRPGTSRQTTELEWDDMFGPMKTERVEWKRSRYGDDGGNIGASESGRRSLQLREEDDGRSNQTFYVKDRRPWISESKGNSRKNNSYGLHTTEMDRAQFLSLIEAMKTTQTARFNGKTTEFPAFRQRIKPYFSMYFDNAPLLLREYLLASITKEVARDVAYNAQREDPKEAVIRIWENLDRLYGNDHEILEELFKGISRPSKSLRSDYKDLQNYWLRLDECQVVVKGMGKEYLLRKGKLLMKLVNGFNQDMKSKFEFRYPDPDQWSYEDIMHHVNAEIKYLKKIRGHTEDQAIDRMDERRERRWNNMKANPIEVKLETRNDDKTTMHCAVHRNGSHSTGDCPKWNELTVMERRTRCRMYGLCYKCLGKHLQINCTSENNCEVCGKDHHTSLHYGKEDIQAGGHKETVQAATHHDEMTTDQKQVPIIALSALAGSSKKVVNFYAFLDSAAERTMGSKNLAEKLEIWNPNDSITLCSMTGRRKVRSMTATVSLMDHKKEMSKLTDVIFAQDVVFPFSQNIPSKSLLSRYKGTEHEKFPAFQHRQVDMVIGVADLWKYQLLFDDGWCTAKEDGPIIKQHNLGWIWIGNGKTRHDDLKQSAIYCNNLRFLSEEEVTSMAQKRAKMVDEENLMDLELNEWKKGFYQDQLIVKPNTEETALSTEDMRAVRIYKESIKEIQEEGQRRLQLALPFKEDSVTLQDNYNVAYKRLIAQKKKLKHDNDRKKKYCEAFEKMRRLDHCLPTEKDTEQSMEQSKKQIVKKKDTECTTIPEVFGNYYLVHFGTRQAKFRVVNNAALKIDGFSLNDLLCKGPMFFPPLASVLIRFREKKYGVVGDIRHMYHNIRLDPKHQNAVRLLWFSEDGMEGEVEEWRYRVMPFGLKPIPSIAGYCMQHTAKMNYPKVPQWIADTLTESFYVDDLYASVNTVEDGKQLVHQMSTLTMSTGFPMAKWNATEACIVSDVPEEDRCPAVRTIKEEKDGLGDQKALGVIFDFKNDTFIMSNALLKKLDKSPTMRTALGQVNSCFDPLGWWCPFLLKLKLGFQKISKKMKSWDEPLTKEDAEEWAQLVEEVQSFQSKKMMIQRRYTTVLPPNSVYELHLFTDASEYAFGACVYIRAGNEDGEIFEVALMAGKSRIFHESKVAKFSIARKELVALATGAQLLDMVRKSTSLNIVKSYMWTDSVTVLKWCRCTDKQLQVFVKNRVNVILEIAKNKQPAYVASEENPADVASRGIFKNHEKEFNFWIGGPDFLKTPERKWTKKFPEYTQDEILSDEKVQKELSRDAKAMICGSWMKDDKKEEKGLLRQILEQETDWKEAVRITTTLLKCIRRWRQEIGAQKEKWDDGGMQMEEMKEGEKILVGYTQQIYFGKIMRWMNESVSFMEAVGKLSTEKREHWMHQIKKLQPFVDSDGLMRVKGRLENSEFTYEQKYPTFVPRRSEATRLIVKFAHLQEAHMSEYATLNYVRYEMGYWIVGGLTTVRFYLKNCTGCLLIQGARGKQVMAPLPRERVSPYVSVFSCVSVDYAGPFVVTNGRKSMKRWLCVLVCMSTTAVKVEMVYSLSTESFLKAFRRFLASTGHVTKKIRSDNATNFVGARNEMRDALKELDGYIREHDKMAKMGIDWEFGPPEASHHYGLHERQIRTIRKIMLGLPDLTHTNPSDEDLLTLFKEAEFIMNTRPLARSGDNERLPPLTPLALMTGKCNDEPLWESTTERDVIRRGYKYTQRIADLWWKRWIHEYIPLLQKRSKWLNEEIDFTPGDLILLCDEPTIRGRYPWAVISEVKTDKDGKVRTVTARKANGVHRTRDVRKIALIEKSQ